VDVRQAGLIDYSDRESQLYGKKIAVAMTNGKKDAFSSGCINALRTFQDAYNFVGANQAGMVYGSAEAPGEIAANSELMQDAAALGKNLVSGK
jgi:hypothetical protein